MAITNRLTIAIEAYKYLDVVRRSYARAVERAQRAAEDLNREELAGFARATGIDVTEALESGIDRPSGP